MNVRNRLDFGSSSWQCRMQPQLVEILGHYIVVEHGRLQFFPDRQGV
jgi:hypothetical protein